MSPQYRPNMQAQPAFYPEAPEHGVILLDEEWQRQTEISERRKAQNRLAQRNFSMFQKEFDRTWLIAQRKAEVSAAATVETATGSETLETGFFVKQFLPFSARISTV